jgi:hypothetical protein
MKNEDAEHKQHLTTGHTLLSDTKEYKLLYWEYDRRTEIQYLDRL